MGKPIFDPPDGFEEYLFLKEQSEKLARGEFTETVKLDPIIFQDKKQEDALKSLQNIENKIEDLKPDNNAKRRNDNIKVIVNRWIAPIIVAVVSGLVVANFQEVSSFVVGLFSSLIDCLKSFNSSGIT